MKKLPFIFILSFVLMLFSTNVLSAEESTTEEDVIYEIAEDDVLFGLLKGMFGEATNIIVDAELPEKPDHIITALSEGLNKALTSLVLGLIIIRFGRWVVAVKNQGGSDVFDFQHAPLPILFAIMAIVPVKSGMSLMQMVTIKAAGYSIMIANYETNLAADFLEKYGSFSTLSHVANIEDNAIATVIGSVCKGILNKRDKFRNIDQTATTDYFTTTIYGRVTVNGWGENATTSREKTDVITYVNKTKYSRSGVFGDAATASAFDAGTGRIARSYEEDACGNSQIIFPELKEDENYMMVGEFRNEVAEAYATLNDELAAISALIVNETFVKVEYKYQDMSDDRIQDVKDAISQFKVAYQDALATLVSQYTPSQASDSAGLNTSSAADVLRSKGTAYLGIYYLELMKKNSRTLDATKFNFSHKMPTASNWKLFYSITDTKTPAGLEKLKKEIKANANADLPNNESGINKEIREGQENIDKIVRGESSSAWQLPTTMVVNTTSYILETLVDENDPVSGIVTAGHYLINSMEAFYLYTQIAETTVKAGKWVAKAAFQMLGGTASDIPWVGGTAKGLAEGTGTGVESTFTFVEDALSLAKFIILPLFLAGIFMAFWLPSIPMIHWINTMVGFLIVTFNTYVLVPALAISHLITTDNKLLGQKTNHGYMAILQLVLYLPLVVISFFGSIMILIAGTKLIQVLYVPIMLSVIGNSLAGILTLFFFMALFLGLHLQMFNRSFALMASTPEKLNEYIGGGAEMLDDKEGVSGTKAIVTNIDSAAKESVSARRMENRGNKKGKGDGDGDGGATASDKSNLNKSVT